MAELVAAEQHAAIEHQIVIRSLLGGAYGGATADRMAAATRSMFFPAGKVIYDAGDASKFVYFLVEGKVELTRPDHEPWVLTDRGVFGILDAELERPHARGARAVTDVRAIAIQTSDWHDIIEDTFEYTRPRILRNAQDLWRRGLKLPPHAGFEGVSVDHATDALAVAWTGDHQNPFERLLVLHLTDLFARAGIQSLTRLSALATEVLLEPDEVLVRQGQPQSYFYVVAKGKVVMERDEPEIWVRFGLNRLVGGYAGIGQETWPVTVRAIEDCCLLRIGYEDLFDVMEDHYDVIRSVMGFLTLERERVQALVW